MLRYILIFLLALFVQSATAQTTADLEAQLAEATSSSAQLDLTYQLAELYLSQGNEDKALEYSERAIELAKSSSSKTILVSSYLLNGQAHYNNRDYRLAAAKYRNGLDYAKSSGEIELAIESYLALIETTKKLRDNGKAARLAEESLTYLKENSNYKKLKGREVSSRNELAKIEQERTNLQRQKTQLEQQINSLRSNQSQLDQTNTQLSQENTNLNQRQEILADQKAKVEQRVNEQEKSIAKMTAQQARTQLLAERRSHLVDSLEQEKVKNEILLDNQSIQLQNVELRLSRGRYVVAVIVSLLLLLGALAIIFYVQYNTKKNANKQLEEKNKTIAEERERSDELLLNILPKDIAQELKTTGQAKARKYSDVTVMFTDFRNFTKMSEVLTPEQLVHEIDRCFRAFDKILSEYPSIEKIKTIGDAYMCASGFSERKTIPTEIIQAGLAFQEYLDELKIEQRQKGLPYFEARIGLHTGPVVAGVVGIKKFAYDIWGDTVNTAARMEQKSEVGQVNISHSTYERIKYNFDCQYRGRIEAKNKGMVDMYYVLRPARVMA